MPHLWPCHLGVKGDFPLPTSAPGGFLQSHAPSRLDVLGSNTPLEQPSTVTARNWHMGTLAPSSYPSFTHLENGPKSMKDPCLVELTVNENRDSINFFYFYFYLL